MILYIISCFDFLLTLSVETVNYQRIDMPLGPFTQPAQKICFNVSIMNNNDCNDDPNLNFTIEMSRQDPFDIGVNIVIPVTTIVIDDSMEPECSKYMYVADSIW